MMGADSGDDEKIDSLQDAFCRLWSRKEYFTEMEQAENILKTTAKNIRIDNFRLKARHPETDITELNSLPDSDQTENAVDETFLIVDRIVKENISERDREILYLRDRDGWDYEDLALRFNLSEANIRMIVSRSRKMIRELYRKQNSNL